MMRRFLPLFLFLIAAAPSEEALAVAAVSGPIATAQVIENSPPVPTASGTAIPAELQPSTIATPSDGSRSHGKLIEIPSGTSSKHVALKSNKVLTVSVDHGETIELREPASSVFIANPDIADVQVLSSTTIMVFGKRTGSTSFLASDTNGAVLERRTVVVSQDMTDLKHELDVALPGNKIHAESVPNGIVLTGDAKDAATVTDIYKIAQRYLSSGGDIINRIKVSGSNQILIRVRFAEVQRSVNNTFGIDWGSALSAGGFVFGLASGNLIYNTAAGILGGNAGTNQSGGNTGISQPTTSSQLISTPFNRTANSTLGLPNDAITGSYRSGSTNINAVVDALAQDGLITILAEPNLIAKSGETANFLAGGEFPIPIPQGNGTVTIEFKSYGISLAFTPTLINDDRISLHVKPEVSQLTTAGSIILDNITVPALTTRRAETSVEVASGQSFAIAGLIDNSQTQTVNKYPFLGDMPILGPLFRSSSFQNGQTELVIIITPYVVRPNGTQQLATPMDGLAPPNETERILKMRYSSADPNARTQSGDPIAVKGEPSVDPAPVIPVTAGVAPVTSITTTSTTTVMTAPPLKASEIPSDTITSVAISAPPSPLPVPVLPPPVTASAPLLPINPARAAPINLTPGGSAPSGPGGFILE